MDGVFEDESYDNVIFYSKFNKKTSVCSREKSSERRKN